MKTFRVLVGRAGRPVRTGLQGRPASPCLTWLLVLALLLTGSAAAQDMPLSQVLLPGESWRLVEGLEGVPGALAADGSGLYIADGKSPVVYRLGSDGKAQRWCKTSGIVHGMCVQSPGVLLATLPEQNRLTTIDKEGEGSKALLEGPAVLDVARAGGQVYYTVRGSKDVFALGRKEPVATALQGPAGLSTWADQGTLVVGEAAGRHLVVFRVRKDGSLDARERYCTLRGRDKQPSAVRALTSDAAHRLYAATAEGVQVFDPTGRMSGVLLSPVREPVTALAFAGKNRDQLFIVCGGRIYMRKTKTKGATTTPATP